MEMDTQNANTQMYNVHWHTKLYTLCKTTPAYLYNL